MAANSPMSARNTVVLTTVESEAPRCLQHRGEVAQDLVRLLLNVSPQQLVGGGDQRGSGRDAKSNPPALIAWE